MALTPACSLSSIAAQAAPLGRPSNRATCGLLAMAVAVIVAGCAGPALRAPADGAAAGKSDDARAGDPSVDATRRPGGYYMDDGPGDRRAEELEALAALPDPVPVREPLHSWANRPYRVLGNDYRRVTRTCMSVCGVLEPGTNDDPNREHRRVSPLSLVQRLDPAAPTIATTPGRPATVIAATTTLTRAHRQLRLVLQAFGGGLPERLRSHRRSRGMYEGVRGFAGSPRRLEVLARQRRESTGLNCRILYTARAFANAAPLAPRPSATTRARVGAGPLVSRRVLKWDRSCFITSWAAKLQPESQKLPLRIRATSCDRDFHREIGRSGVLRGRERIFWFGGPNKNISSEESRAHSTCRRQRETQNLGSHGSRSPDLPVNLGGSRHEPVSTTAARRASFSFGLGRQGSFCKRAAARQPPM